MTRRSLPLSVAVLCLAALLVSDVRIGHTQANSNELFDASTLQEIRLLINTRDLAALREGFEDNTVYPADLVWRNTRLRNVAVRSRGFGSRSATKLSLEVDFNHYASDQRFVGLKSIVLKNLLQDASMVREKVALGLYDRMGQPPSRESFSRLYINNVYQGLYAIVESVNADFLTRVFGNASGNLFEYHRLFFWNFDYLGDDIAPYQPMFEARTHELDADTILYSPIRDMLREVNGPDDAVWRDRVEALIDVRQFLTMVAIEIFLGESDGLTGDFGTANFYLYRPPGSTRYQLIVWDRDHSMFEAVDQSIFYRTDINALFRRAIKYSDLNDHYLNELQRSVDLAQQDGWFENEVAKYSALIIDAAHEDPGKAFTNEQVDDTIAIVKDFARRRPAFVLSQIAKARAGK